MMVVVKLGLALHEHAPFGLVVISSLQRKVCVPLLNSLPLYLSNVLGKHIPFGGNIPKSPWTNSPIA